MADAKISALPAAENLTGAVVPIVQDGANKKAAAALFGGAAPALRHAWASPYSYCGTAPADSADDAEVWTISRIEMAADGSVVATLTVEDVAWDDRLTATYA